MKTGTIKQTVTFNASPKKVYELLMDAKLHGKFTGGKVKISTKIHGEFNVFDGYCHGYNLELEEGKKIIQAWNFKEEGWPAEHYSVCTFLFKKDGKNTKLSFTQNDVPAHKIESLKSGWKNYYWNPMKEFIKTTKY